MFPRSSSETCCRSGISAGVRGEITRLEAFCDVVSGFALTLLVVSLEVPRNYAELTAAIRGFVPFAACFYLPCCMPTPTNCAMNWD